MAKENTELKSWLKECPVIAILRGIRPEEAEAIGNALYEAGIRIVEVPLNSPNPSESISTLARIFGDRMLVGAGTLTEVAQVADVARVGGRLIVTPHADVSIVRAAKEAGLFAVPGFFNPTEAFALLKAGADAIKLFPAEVLGPPMLKALRAVLPNQAMVIPVGGVDAASIPIWKAAGADGFGAGSSLYKPGDDVETVWRKAVALINATR
ncbi:MAG TPA: 2-dehydro-3-deoxy-6-phosphogalactonate aldolase [Edaphobacter sp.]|nr:2-dehydro-3-deoxy-6-phosphogalactonate aldolase [Edaphobacter sp.]